MLERLPYSVNMICQLGAAKKLWWACIGLGSWIMERKRDPRHEAGDTAPAVVA